MLKPRQKKFLDNINSNGFNISKGAIDAGYSPVYADKQGKVLLKSALKEHAKEIVSTMENKDISKTEGKKLMIELMGMSREDTLNRLKTIANQDKDLHSALKVLIPLARELGISLESDANVVNVPVLNITVTPNDGLIEPPIDGNQ